MDSLVFPKAVVNQSLIDLHNKVVPFVTQLILKHETEFHHFFTTSFDYLMVKYLVTPNDSIQIIIEETTLKFYQKLSATEVTPDMTPLRFYYNDVFKDEIISMPHLLQKLTCYHIRLHQKIDRSKLILTTLETYKQSVLDQINIVIVTDLFYSIFAE